MSNLLAACSWRKLIWSVSYSNMALRSYFLALSEFEFLLEARVMKQDNRQKHLQMAPDKLSFHFQRSG